MLLEHASGFANFGFLEPDGKFDPGARYGYSGDGILLLRLVLEQGLGLDVCVKCRAACSVASACAAPV